MRSAINVGERVPSLGGPLTQAIGWAQLLLLLSAPALMLVAVGCSDTSSRDAILLEVRTPGVTSQITLRVKRYYPDGHIEFYPDLHAQVPGDWDGYVNTVGGLPLRFDVEFPAPGRYAVHLVGQPAEGEGEVYVATLCRAVSGVHVERGVHLGRLTAALDADGDTFPDERGAFCAGQLAIGVPCETSCDVEEYRAMVDCNPPEGFLPPEGCGAVDAAVDWNPFVVDSCGDCYDQDCYDGDRRCEDRDRDGFPGGGIDCDDNNAEVYPGAEEICGNDIDDNCAIDIPACTDGDIPCDADGDLFRAIRAEFPGCGSDCDDTVSHINPGGFEGCGSNPLDTEACPGCPPGAAAGLDENCNGSVDEGCFPNDIDNDGVPEEEDCDDCNSAVGAGFPEVCGNGVDEDCSGDDLLCSGNDSDSDGVEAPPSGGDCDDDDASIYPGAPDRCGDGIAQNCGFDVDCADITDNDNDDFGAVDPDCDDSRADINPWALEVCDPAGADEDCDGRVNEVVGGGSGCGFDPSAGQWYVINYDSDDDHCGGCRHRCCAGPCDCAGDACEGGECRCAGDVACGGDATDFCCPDGCQDLSTDVLNCGFCAYECGQGEACIPGPGCERGVCTCVSEADGAPCPADSGTICCPGTGCTDVAADVDNCGTCGEACTARVGVGPRGDICAPDGHGNPRCYCGDVPTRCDADEWCTNVTDPENSCGCRNLDTDRDHCGSCHSACESDEECSDGVCVCASAGRRCRADEECCPGDGCVSVTSDAENCGGCGISCAWGESCVDRDCRCGSGTGCDPATQNCCDGGCRDVRTDSDYCGDVGDGAACSWPCPSGIACVRGECQCDRDWTDCGTACDCQTGRDQVCCGGECFDGECCDDDDCSGDTNPHCDSATHRCWCADEGGTCSPSRRCCPGEGCLSSCG